ncbi:hypothetical protein HanXRQr2_Chr11g0497801 [Helianthus annuus]|uniref:Uncharacterized protein n=1 Tax=Helianthus annuus TaxID=4232 RepID=A0A9K3HQE9_HELAN|nr:hypothetical protein HanXRQr2_Chr11g0497801 [Helianthus annuus]KAJ0875717.1 hypothetical protein HanPSC8_Chr11g0479801 [Helianthus annuus]
MKSINTPHPFHSSSHLNLILHSLSGSICFLPESESGSNLAGTFCKYSFAFIEMIHRIDQDTHRRTWALVTIKDARLVDYVIFFVC